MKKKNVINLIRYYSEGNNAAFIDEAYEIASDFNSSGDTELGNYVLALLSGSNTFVPQTLNHKSDFLKKAEYSNTPLPLPNSITENLIGIINAIGHHAGINKFLFSGAPGTGKTESAKHLSRVLNRELYIVDFDSIIDSKLGQTSKNISLLFNEINNFYHPDKVIVLFDEIDALAMDRLDSRDLREMGRATSSVLKGLDTLNPEVVVIATTNLLKAFDKAFVRRFDKIIDFNCYSAEDLRSISETILEDLLDVFKFAGRDVKLFRKIINTLDPIPFPGELKNMIRSAIAFSNPNDEYDYLRRLFAQINPDFPQDFQEYKKLGFTLREIETLTRVPKSSVLRELSKAIDKES